ncbi:MAG: chemotaxis protein CheW [Acidobacteriota bacterium]
MIQEKARGEKHRNFLLVRSGESRFALPVSIVERIVHDLPYHSVPGAQPRLLGLAQFAGEPLPVLHLRAAVEGGEVTDTGTWSIIIVSHRNRADRSLLGLAVGELKQSNSRVKRQRSSTSISSSVVKHGILER